MFLMLLMMEDGRWVPVLVRGAIKEEEESQAAAETLLLMCWLGTGRSIPRRRRDGDLTVGLYTSEKRSKIAKMHLEKHTRHAALQSYSFLVLRHPDNRSSRVRGHETESTTAFLSIGSHSSSMLRLQSHRD
jgi:hypothetical protein